MRSTRARPRPATSRRAAPCGGQHPSRREPGRGALVARRRHPRLSADLAEHGRHGLPGPPDSSTQPVARTSRETFKRFEPTSRDGAPHKRLSSAPEHQPAIHKFQRVSPSWRRGTGSSPQLVDSSNENFSAFADEKASLREAIRCSRAPPQTHDPADTRTSSRQELGPALEGLRPSRASWRRRSAAAAVPRETCRSCATRSGRSPATSSPRCATCAAPRRTWRPSPGQLTRSFKVSTTSSTARLPAARQQRVVPLLGRLGGARRRPLTNARTHTAR